MGRGRGTHAGQGGPVTPASLINALSVFPFTRACQQPAPASNSKPTPHTFPLPVEALCWPRSG